MKPLFFSMLSTLIASPLFANVSGFVTPTTVSITINSASLKGSNNVTLVSSSVTHNFNRTDTDMSASSLGSISVPAGRYTSVQVCYNTSRSVTLNGVVYEGSDQSGSGGFANGDTLYSTGTDATATNTLTTSAPSGGGTSLSGLVVGSGTENCSETVFATPICVAAAADQASTCSSGDTKLDPSTTSPDLNLMLDMYHCVGVDASSNKQLDNHVACYPYATLGKPGAAVHLIASSGGSYADIVMLVGNDGNLAYTSSNSNNSFSGLCTGVGAVDVTAVPSTSSATVNSGGPNWVMSLDATSGLLQFASGNCGNSTSCTSSGMVTVANALQKVGSTTSVTCVADSAATPAYLGYTYTSGAGVAGNTTFTVARVVDPYAVLGLCDSSDSNYVSGSTPSGATGGTCALVHSGSTPGYP